MAFPLCPARLPGLLARIALLAAVAPAPAAPAPPGVSAPVAREATLAEIQAHVAGRPVLMFGGYSGAGYEDEAALLAIARATLAAEDPRQVLVAAGGTAEGIGAVYVLARAMGFGTLGIVSTLARDEGVALSPAVDIVFFVADASWGGRQADGRLSPTSQAVVAVGTRFVAIGGGDIARDEFAAARAAGKPVVFHPADMQHAAARAKARRQGQPEPTDFRGSAHVVLAAPG